MSHKTKEDIIAANTERMAVEQEMQDFERRYADSIQQLLNEFVKQVAEELQAPRGVA
jgi:hypothetical protein